MRRPYRSRRQVQSVWEPFGDPKISNLDLHAVVEEHVAQFQIPVQSGVMCLVMNLYLLPVYDLVVVQVLTAQEDLNYYKVTIDNSYLIVSNGINEPILWNGQGGSSN